MKIYDQEVLYVGDYIFGDILKIKKVRGWRIFLVVLELAQEFFVWIKKKILFERFEDLDMQIGEMYRLVVKNDFVQDVIYIYCVEVIYGNMCQSVYVYRK